MSRKNGTAKDVAQPAPVAEERAAGAVSPPSADAGGAQAGRIAALECTIETLRKRLENTQGMLSRYINAQLLLVEENASLRAQIEGRPASPASPGVE